MAVLRLFLLGAMDIRHDDQQVPKPPTLKSQSLLAYLAMHRGRPQNREQLAGLFWGDRPERKARRSLRTALWHIRRYLPQESVLLSDTTTVLMNPDSDLWLDVEEFETHASSGQAVTCNPCWRSTAATFSMASMTIGLSASATDWKCCFSTRCHA